MRESMALTPTMDNNNSKITTFNNDQFKKFRSLVYYRNSGPLW
jgi:hypothetical protein